MNMKQLLDLIANNNVSDEKIEHTLCENFFYLSDIEKDLENRAEQVLLLETKRRKCSITHQHASRKEHPRVYAHTKKYLYILQGKILLSEYNQELFTLRKIKTEIISVGEVIPIPPGMIHQVTPYDTESIFIEVSLSNMNFDEPNIFHENFKILDPDTPPSDYYYGYDERYQMVYAAGADLWETDQPNEPIIQFIQRYDLAGKKIIDLGCGEGRDSLYLASKGYNVLGVDVSRAALEKARSKACDMNINCKFIERDVVYLRTIKNESFDIAINMGCLHMMPDPIHRKLHLDRVWQILKPGGYFLVAHCRGEWLKGFFSVPDYQAVGPVIPGRIINRRIRVNGGTKMIPLPLVPYKESSEEELKKELHGSAFTIVESLGENTDAFGNTAVLLARKL